MGCVNETEQSSAKPPQSPQRGGSPASSASASCQGGKDDPRGPSTLEERMARAKQNVKDARAGAKRQGHKLPDGWTSCVDPASGDTYYYHAETGRTQWNFPKLEMGHCVEPQLPEGWCFYSDPTSGDPYYHHAATDRTQWNFPATELLYEVTLDGPRQSERKLGLVWEQDVQDGTLRIGEIIDGQVRNHNRKHPENDVRVGDMILACNGVRLTTIYNLDGAVADLHMSVASSAQVTMIFSRKKGPDFAEGWTAYEDPESGDTYYTHAGKGHTQWNFPMAAELPEGWAAYVDPASGVAYYCHAERDKTQWHFPKAEVPKAEALPVAVAVLVQPPVETTEAMEPQAAAAPVTAIFGDGRVVLEEAVTVEAVAIAVPVDVAEAEQIVF